MGDVRGRGGGYARGRRAHNSENIIALTSLTRYWKSTETASKPLVTCRSWVSTSCSVSRSTTSFLVALAFTGATGAGAGGAGAAVLPAGGPCAAAVFPSCLAVTGL